MNNPIKYEPSQGSNYSVWGDLYSFKTTSAESGGAHALFEMTVNPGSGTPPHIHHAEDEMFYVLEGELSLWCGDEKTIGTPGSYVAIPKGTIHRWANESNAPAKSLVFLVPGGFDEFLMKIGKPVNASEQASLPPSKKEIEEALALAADYHMEVIQ